MGRSDGRRLIVWLNLCSGSLHPLHFSCRQRNTLRALEQQSQCWAVIYWRKSSIFDAQASDACLFQEHGRGGRGGWGGGTAEGGLGWSLPGTVKPHSGNPDLKKGANETDFKHKIPRTEVKKRKKKKGIHSEYVFVVTQSKRKLLYDVAADVLQMKTLW